jgi:hypothetical protein
MLTRRAVRHEQLRRVGRRRGVVEHGLLRHRLLQLLLMQQRRQLLVEGAAVHRGREVALGAKGLKEARVVLVEADVRVLEGRPALPVDGVRVGLRARGGRF